MTESGSRNVLIVSAGKFGREVYSFAREMVAARNLPWTIKGFLDDRKNLLDGLDYDVGIVSSVEDYVPAPNDVFIGALGDVASKRKYCGALLDKGAEFINVIHPTAVIGRNVALGRGVVVCPQATLTCDVRVGDFVTLGVHSNAAHDVVIGDWCQISGHCGLNGNVRLEEGVFLGSHAVILPGVVVERDATVGAGAVVLKRVEADQTVIGNPARSLG